MIQIDFKTDKDGVCRGFTCKGHAGYGYAETSFDIVCASASVLVINTINSIESFTQDKISYSSDEKTGTIDFSFDGEVSHESELLIDSLTLGLKGIEKQYGKKFIKVRL